MPQSLDCVEFGVLLQKKKKNEINDAIKGSVCSKYLKMNLLRAYAKLSIISLKWAPGLKKGEKNHFSLWIVKRERGKFERESGEETRGGGWNFVRSVAGKAMRREGLGTVGLLHDAVSGRQEYRKTVEGRDMLTESLLFFFFLTRSKK